MRESIKMEDYDGFQWIKEQKTKILPLRWFANLCEKPAAYHLESALRYDSYGNHGVSYKLHSRLSNLFYKPYFKWGTIYKLDTPNDIMDYNPND
jgi:hypothetical protein